MAGLSWNCFGSETGAYRIPLGTVISSHERLLLHWDIGQLTDQNPQMVKRLNLGNELYLDLLELGKLDQWAKPFRQAYTMILSTYHNGHFQHAAIPQDVLPYVCGSVAKCFEQPTG